jgi:hypothetical protein
LQRFLACACFIVLAACGGDESITLTEYAEQGQAVVTAMEERLAALDAQWGSRAPTAERARTYWENRVDALLVAQEQLEELVPPDEIEDLHEPGMALFDKLIVAEQALAARVASFDTVTEPDEWWDTAEGKAVEAVNAEIADLCLVFQAMYDATLERVIFTEAPWLPSEMKEVVRIDIGC